MIASGGQFNIKYKLMKVICSAILSTFDAIYDSDLNKATSNGSFYSLMRKIDKTGQVENIHKTMFSIISSTYNKETLKECNIVFSYLYKHRDKILQSNKYDESNKQKLQELINIWTKQNWV